MTELQLQIAASLLTLSSFIALIAALYYDKLDKLLKSIVWGSLIIVMVWFCYAMWLITLKAYVV